MWLLSVYVGFVYVVSVWCQMDGYFLPKTVKPIRYNLTIGPDTFDINRGLLFGSVTIDVEALENTNNITLHSRNLKINKYGIIVKDCNGNKLKLEDATEDEEKQFYIIHLKEHLVRGEKYQVIISKYVGSMLNEKAGFYYAKYKDSNDNDKYMAVTEFEPTDARRTFPCFDEPHLKATFIINIVREASYISASNQELLSTKYLRNNLYLDTFKETLPMSTYIVAFTVTEFKYTKKNENVRILGRPEAVEDGSMEYVLDNSVKLLKNLEMYTRIPYALKKLDLLAVPSDYFLDGAMENWGLIVYNEKYLLCTNTSSSIDKQKCVTYSGHEFAHQWFGNLVSPKSWHYMWLSEGFAAYIQYFVTALVEPTWRLDEQYVVDQLQSCFRSDIPPLTEAINYEFTDSEDFPSSVIYYYKASAVIRMIEHVVTNNLFVKSLQMYLQIFKFDSTVPDDLFNVFEKVIDDAKVQQLLGGLTFHQFIDPWVTNKGHPLVNVSRDYKTGDITFTQRTFAKKDEAGESIWPIPITYFLSGIGPQSFNETMTDFWFTKKSTTIQTFSNFDWVLVNKHMIGYYRTMYDTTNWKRLIHHLQTNDINVIPPVNRAQLIDDAIYYSQLSLLDVELALNLTTYLNRETDYIPINAFLTNIVDLDHSLTSKSEYAIFKNYIKLTLNASYKNVGLTERAEDTHIDRLHRVQLAEWMCRFEDPYCQKVGSDYLNSWEKTGMLQIPTDLQFSLLCGAIQISTPASWKFLLNQYYSCKDGNIKSQLIKALGCTTEESKINHFMDIIYELNDNITPDDRSLAVGSIMQFSEKGLNTVLDYLINVDVSNKTLEDAFSPVEAIIGLSSHHDHQLTVLKKTKNLMDLPIFFYTEESLSDEEMLFYDETAKWLQRYRTKIVEQSSFAHL
ncbi:hypothetical protein FQR65_LT04958 [Abscondita terminalis]|nr:hypothetical protein FQR65_LT04958 [Abscondita terminalis]